MGDTIYDRDLDRQPANHQPLTPLLYLERAARVFPAQVAVIHGPLRRTYAELDARARRLASALKARGIGRGDTVAALLANTPEMVECHYGVPMAGAVLCTLNTRLDAAAIRFCLEHGEAKVLIVDREFSRVAGPALEGLDTRPFVIDVDDPEYDGPGEALGETGYEAFLAGGTRRRTGRCPATNGTRSPSTTPPAPPAIPRASSTTTGGRRSCRSATSSPAGSASTRSISGPCRCSTATAGASPGPCRSWPAPMSACGRSGRRRCTG